jgi:RND superfamily putative drug exporter
VLLLVLGSPVGAAIPLMFGGSVVLAGWGLLDIVNRFTSLDVGALSLVTAMGLALGVDYSLLMVARFQAELARGTPVDRASRVASARAGQTIRFAAIALGAAMVCALIVIPAAPLKSGVVGVLIAAIMGVTGAMLALPPLLRVVGEDINRFRIFPAVSQSGRWRALALAVLRKPVVGLLAVLALLVPLCLPVAGFPTGPPDPSVLPEGVAARTDLEAIKRSIPATYSVPFLVTVAADKGTLADERFQELAKFERRLERDPGTHSVLGPARVATRTAALARVPDQLKRVDSEVKKGQKGLARLRRGLGQASSGAELLIAGLRTAAGGSQRLNSGTGEASDGATRISDGAAAAARGAKQLRAGLAKADAGTRALNKGAGQASAGTRKLAAGLSLTRRRTREAVAGSATLASGLERGQEALRQLQEPAKLATDEAQKALKALQEMAPTSMIDPAYRRAYESTAKTVAALTGRNPLNGDKIRSDYDGLEAALNQAATQAGEAANGAGRLRDGGNELLDALGRLADGSKRLRKGAGQLEDGTGELADGQRRLLAGATKLRDGLDELANGTGKLSAGAKQLAAGTSKLAGALGMASGKAAPFGSGLDQLYDGATEADRRTAELSKELTGSTKLAPLFSSGYTTLAALETAPKPQREAARWAINYERGGRAVQFLVVQKEPKGSEDDLALPTRAGNKYRDRLEKLTHDLGRDLDATALVGGPTPTLAEFDHQVVSRLKVLVIALVLVTYLGLVLLMRNWLLPAIAVVLNVLSVGAAFGILALLFGGEAPVLGGPGYIDVIMAAVVFTVTFALSIDYQIFLLDRMREGYAETRSVQGAIVYGLENTAGVITGAGAIMVAVFLAFAVSPMPTMRQLGLGLAVAVFLDATLIRLVLLPAMLKLAGHRAWPRIDAPIPAAAGVPSAAITNGATSDDGPRVTREERVRE